jgi:hypothetical protein
MVGGSHSSKRSWKHVGPSLLGSGLVLALIGQPTADGVCAVGRVELSTG